MIAGHDSLSSRFPMTQWNSIPRNGTWAKPSMATTPQLFYIPYLPIAERDLFLGPFPIFLLIFQGIVFVQYLFEWFQWIKRLMAIDPRYTRRRLCDCSELFFGPMAQGEVYIRRVFWKRSIFVEGKEVDPSPCEYLFGAGLERSRRGQTTNRDLANTDCKTSSWQQCRKSWRTIEIL